MVSTCHKPRCMVCASILVRNGKTRAGTVRWRCKTCGASQVQHRKDIRLKNDARLFTHWLFHNVPINSLSLSRSTFARRVLWCWKVPIPGKKPTGVIESQILLDGIYLPYRWCLLIAMNTHHVLAWQWCQRENYAAYHALLNQLIEPYSVCVDGGPGVLKALHLCWPKVKLQRCLVHVVRNVRTYVTNKPRDVCR